MRVLILSDDFPPQSLGGASFSALGLAGGLQKAGHEVFVITTVRDKSEAREKEPDIYKDMKVFKIFADYRERWRAYLSLYNPQTAGKVKRLIKEINPDIVHANNIHYYLSYRCLKIARQHSKAVFLTARDTMLFSYGKLATKRYLESFDIYGKLVVKKADAKVSWIDNLKQAKKRYNPFRNIIIRHYLRYVDKIFAISYALKDALNQNGIQNVEVIYNAINADDWQLKPEFLERFKKDYQLEGKKIILLAGRIGKLKGLEKISLAMEKVKKEVPEAVLFTPGGGDIGWVKEDENKKDKEKDEWRHWGPKPSYWASDVVVTPSIYLDPFNRTNIEAMACKKPVVGTCYGGTLKIVKEGITGYIVNPLNTDLLAEKIIDLLKNPEKARQFGQAGFERVKKHFGLAQHIDETVSFYSKYANTQ